jgi:hypothetical protein
MPKNSDRNKITDRSELKVHNRNQLGRPKGKLIKPIPRSNDVAVIVPLKEKTYSEVGLASKFQ